MQRTASTDLPKELIQKYADILSGFQKVACALFSAYK